MTDSQWQTLRWSNKSAQWTCLISQDHAAQIQSSNRRKYDATFKADVIKMIANGQSVAYVAQALGISEALIYKWKQRTKGEVKYHSSIQTSDMMIENQRLLQRINQLETEREILKKGRMPCLASQIHPLSDHSFCFVMSLKRRFNNTIPDQSQKLWSNLD